MPDSAPVAGTHVPARAIKRFTLLSYIAHPATIKAQHSNISSPCSPISYDKQHMDCTEEHQQQQEDVMEVPEINGELLDASLAAEEGTGHDKHQLGFAADVVGDGWNNQVELNSIHPHQEGCEDCGLDDILSNFGGCGFSPAPYAANDVPVEYWTEEMEATTVGPFTGDCMGEWYMDGVLMEWDDGRGYYSFYPSYSGEACTEQLYGSPLWE